MSQRLCLYCATEGHEIKDCHLLQGKQNNKSQVPNDILSHHQQLFIEGFMYLSHHRVSLYFLLDSGSAGTFISQSLVSSLSLPVVKLANSISVNALDGCLVCDS